MEGIVVGIAQINFQQDLTSVADENSAPNFAMESSTSMSASENCLPKSGELDTVCNQDVSSSNSFLSETDTIDDSGWEEIEEDSEKKTWNRRGYTLAERRQMPTRASKESSLLGIKRRTIMKPNKRVRKNEDFQNLKPADIKKIYLNKKLTNFKPSSLETIFEETSSTNQNNEQDYMRLMGGRKIKRSLSCSDGFRYTKTLVNKRRAKIKKTFGKRFALKKISLEEFITKLNTSIEKDDPDATNNDCPVQKVGTTAQTQFTACSEMFVSNISVPLHDVTIVPKNVAEMSTTEFRNNMSL